MDDVRHLPVAERVKYFQEKMVELVKKTDIEAIPTLGIGVSAAVANITMIDLQNDEMLARFGRTKIKKADEEENPPFNPQAN